MLVTSAALLGGSPRGQHFQTKTDRRLVDSSTTPSSPDLLHDASAPQPETTGWRLADSLAEIGMTTTAVWLLMTVASLGACALCSWQGRQGPKPGWRAGRAAQNEEDNVCHVA